MKKVKGRSLVITLLLTATVWAAGEVCCECPGDAIMWLTKVEEKLDNQYFWLPCEDANDCDFVLLVDRWRLSILHDLLWERPILIDDTWWLPVMRSVTVFNTSTLRLEFEHHEVIDVVKESEGYPCCLQTVTVWQGSKRVHVICEGLDLPIGACNVCDLTGDGRVDFHDLALLAQCWLVEPL